MNRKSIFLALAIGSLLVGPWPGLLRAASYTWKPTNLGTATLNWNSNANWDPNTGSDADPHGQPVVEVRATS